MPFVVSKRLSRHRAAAIASMKTRTARSKETAACSWWPMAWAGEPWRSWPAAFSSPTCMTRSKARPLEADRISDAVLSADKAIAGAIARVTDRPGASTVALCAPLDRFAAKWMLAWVGDCRIYRWSPRAQQRLEVLTRDDTFANLGEPPPAGGSADDPARMVGNGATSGANAALHELACGEMLALCSDGLHKHLEYSDWCRLLDSPLPLARRGRAAGRPRPRQRQRRRRDVAAARTIDAGLAGPKPSARARIAPGHQGASHDAR